MSVLMILALLMSVADVPNGSPECPHSGVVDPGVTSSLLEYIGPSRWSSRSGLRKPLPTELRVGKLLADPAIRCYYQSLEPVWFQGLVGPSARTDAMIAVARTLYFENGKVGPDNAAEAFSRVRVTRQRLASFDLFKGRNVVLAASKGQAPDGRPAFGRGNLVRRISRVAATVRLVREQDGVSALKKQIVGGQSLTLVFEGHGNAGGLSFGRGLTARKLASMLEQRKDPTEEVVIVLSSCDAHTVARELLEDFDIGPAVVLVSEEFGQTLVRSIYSDPFLHHELGLATGDTSLDSIRQRAKERTTAYRVNGDGRMMQLF